MATPNRFGPSPMTLRQDWKNDDFARLPLFTSLHPMLIMASRKAVDCDIHNKFRYCPLLGEVAANTRPAPIDQGGGAADPQQCCNHSS